MELCFKKNDENVPNINVCQSFRNCSNVNVIVFKGSNGRLGTVKLFCGEKQYKMQGNKWYCLWNINKRIDVF